VFLHVGVEERRVQESLSHIMILLRSTGFQERRARRILTRKGTMEGN
jgi:hypothetical protein